MSSSQPTRQPDPLQLKPAIGLKPLHTSTNAPTKAESDAALKAGAEVPSRIQDGPTCGLYALGMVMDFWDIIEPRNLNPLVLAADAKRKDSHSREVDTELRLFDVAKKLGYTVHGEMFYSHKLASLARQFGYRARVINQVTIKDIRACVNARHPLLIPFDVDQNGNPGLFGGKRAHWAVIQSRFKKDGIEYVIAKHGWSNKNYVWKAEDLLASSNQLNASDFSTAPKDIRETIRSRAVEVFPQDHQTALPRRQIATASVTTSAATKQRASG